MTAAILYVRFSSGPQAKGDSTDRQLRLCRSLCVQNGWEVAGTLHDEARSGFHGHNRLEGAALGALEREVVNGIHAGKVLVIERLDRLSRQDHNETLDLIRHFTRNGLSIATVEGGRIYEAGKPIEFAAMIELLVKLRMNYEESSKKAEHARERWKARRVAMRSHVAVTKLCPPWLQLLPDRSAYEVIGAGCAGDRGALVRRIFELADSGLGSVRIARLLNDEGTPLWERFANREPKQWGRTFISRLLADPRVIGDLQPMREEGGRRILEGDPIRGYYPRVVDADLFQRVSGSAALRKDVRGNRSQTLANLLSGLTRCSICNTKMEYRQGRKEGHVRVRAGTSQAPSKRSTASLVCPRHSCTNKRYVAYLSLERALVENALHLALDEASFRRVDDVAKLDIRIADTARDYQIAHAGAVDLWREAGSPIAKMLAREREAQAEALKNELDSLHQKRRTAAGQASAAEHLSRLRHVRENLYCQDGAERLANRAKVAAGFRSVVDRIICQPDGSALVWFIDNARLIKILPQQGRRQPLVSDFDLVHPVRRRAALEDPVLRGPVSAYLARVHATA